MCVHITVFKHCSLEVYINTRYANERIATSNRSFLSDIHWRERMSPNKTISYILLLCVAGLVACQHSKYQISKEWNSWKARHGKSYETQKEEMERHLVWLSNREYINAHNENEESVGFTLGMNQFGDMVSVCECVCYFSNLT